jgi:site-specific DNA-methyltransferase (adenine-specific)
MISETKRNTIYSKCRDDQFNEIVNCLNKFTIYNNLKSLVAHGDSLELLKLMPDHSVSLILTDPPYHSTKKDNITNDTAFDTDAAFLSWMGKFFQEWKRVLRPNGSIFVFCSSTMSAKLEVMMEKSFNVLSHVVWTKPNDPGFDGWKGKMKKEALRQWYAHSERILFAEPAVEGNLKRSWFGQFLRQKRVEAGLSGHKLTELTGSYGKVNHGGAVSNWETGRNIPSKEQYDKICEAIFSTGKIDQMPIYEDVIRPFEVNAFVEFTDVWNFNSVRPYKGKHPAEKPLDMLEHCILSTTFENDIVLDCFSGSGSTAIAALNLNRKNISFEIEIDWVNTIADRIKNHSHELINIVSRKHDIMKVNGKKNSEKQPSLFI